MSVLEIWFVEQTTALLGLLGWIAVPPLLLEVLVIQQITTGLAALPPIHAALKRGIVTLMKSVLEILCVEETTALMGILQWIAVPPLLQLLANLTVAMTGWRCPMDTTLKSSAAAQLVVITMEMVIILEAPSRVLSPALD